MVADRSEAERACEPTTAPARVVRRRPKDRKIQIMRFDGKRWVPQGKPVGE